MGGRFYGNWRITAATLFSAVLVAGAFFLAKSIESPPAAQAADEASLLQAIAMKDSSGDGLPDWEKSLYGIPLNASTTDYFHLGMTDGEAVAKGLIVPKAIADIPAASPSSASAGNVDYSAYGITAPTEGTLTDAFAKNFFSLYVSAKSANGNSDLAGAEASALASQALSQFLQNLAPASDLKTMANINISGSGKEAMAAYAAGAEQVLEKNTSTATTSELLYLQYAIENNDADALAHINSIAKAYRDSAAGLAALAVPKELAASDLELVNALARVGGIIGDFARIDTDPLRTMLALEQYVPAARALGKAYADVNAVYVASGVTLPPGTPGATFVSVAAVIAARQQANVLP